MENAPQSSLGDLENPVSTKNLDYEDMIERRQIALNRGDPIDNDAGRPTV